MKKGFQVFLILIMGLFILGGLSSCSIIQSKDEGSTEVNPVVNTDALGQVVKIDVSSSNLEINDTVSAVEKVYDSVVVINASSMSGTSSGSGIIIGESDEYTYIVTCCHVIEGYSGYEVTTNDGKTYTASLIGGDPTSDLAVIALKTTNLTKATFIDDSDQIKIGSEAIAIGNPLGTLGGTVTKGIISSTSRNIKMSDGSIHNLIQTDASINSGNSGGGLFNNQGLLIGVVSAKYSATGVEGLGFAIPANQVKEIATSLIENGYVVGRSVLGVTFADGYYRDGSSFFGGNYHDVVYVSNIESGSSCDGLLKKEDILVNITVTYQDKTKDNSKLESFSNASEVNDFLSNLQLTIGDKITFTIKRGSYTTTSSTVEVVMSQYIFK